MMNYTNYSDREKLETLFKQSEAKAVEKTNLFLVINSLWEHIVLSLTKEQEPKIWQSCDRSGKLWWHGYDPVTGRSICRDSEAEMRIWIEERYYQ